MTKETTSDAQAEAEAVMDAFCPSGKIEQWSTDPTEERYACDQERFIRLFGTPDEVASHVASISPDACTGVIAGEWWVANQVYPNDVADALVALGGFKVC